MNRLSWSSLFLEVRTILSPPALDVRRLATEYIKISVFFKAKCPENRTYLLLAVGISKLIDSLFPVRPFPSYDNASNAHGRHRVGS
jgi:hypothetical protein